METIWFIVVVLMLGAYVVLDGFDFGAGILHVWLAKNDQERRTVFSAIGPFWDGNEVWLLAGGGILVYAFPRAYSAGFSGFYMPLMFVLWLLILRGISIEFRSHHENSLWRSFWDGVFGFASSCMAVVLGAALGNVIRGVPLDATGFFAGPLFTNFQPGVRPGVLDWYTVLVGVFALVVLTGHGALFLAWKTEAELHQRSRVAARRLWTAVMVLLVPVTLATHYVQPALFSTLVSRPWTWGIAALVVVGLGLLSLAMRRGQDLTAFLGSCLFIVSMLAATAAGLYPNLLVSTLSPAYNLTVQNAASGGIGMSIGLGWWIPAIVLALAYFAMLFRFFRGKVSVSEDGHGY